MGVSLVVNGQTRTLHNGVATLPAPSGAAPTANDADSIASWRSGGAAPRAALISIKPGVATTLAAGARYVGYDADSTRAGWYDFGPVNNGAAVAITADVGFSQVLADVPAWAQNIRIVGTITGATTITVYATPYQYME